ncbi:MAG TPA: DUF4350 domain-containing protein [Candidatus Obscuribacter sp.]|nr:DUF4350 domain-containing protein [Candidatus Obscuribacter sp.]
MSDAATNMEKVQPRKGGLPRDLIIQLGALLVVSGLLTYAALSSDKQLEKLMPESKIFASSYNLKPSGVSGLFELCEKISERGRKIVRWEKPYRKLKGGSETTRFVDASRRKETLKEAHGTLLIVRPDEALAEFEVTEILDWVKQGNSLIYLDDFRFHFSRRLLDKIGLKVVRLDKPLEDRLSDRLPVKALLAGSNAQTNNDNSDDKIDAIAPLYTHLSVLRLTAGEALSGGQALVKVDGHTLITQKTWGKGKILISSAPSMLSNKLVGKTEAWGNFQFFANWLATTNGDIIFDEVSHGFKNGSNVFIYFLRGPAGYVTLQILALLIIAILSAHQRFGRIEKLKDARKIADSEYISGLANTYQRASARRAALEIIHQNLHNRLAKLLSVSPHEPGERILEVLRARNEKAWSEDFRSLVIKTMEDLEHLLKANQDKNAAPADNHKEVLPPISEETFKELAIACDKICKQLDSKLTTESSPPASALSKGN